MAIARQVAGIVRRVLADPAYRVYLFGSWVSGEAAARSDVDIGIEGPALVSPVAMVKIREACDTLSTLRTVDIVISVGSVRASGRASYRYRWSPSSRDRG
jgi:predicted nucleotidyltransferase